MQKQVMSEYTLMTLLLLCVVCNEDQTGVNDQELAFKTVTCTLVITFWSTSTVRSQVLYDSVAKLSGCLTNCYTYTVIKTF